ncbi:MAG: DUF3850 domain-containing protein [Nitratireductor sp.]|nr:DUF3850 domain-containing protein [Nitratireductor sp.]
MPRTHILKVKHEYMDALKSGEKPFEVRRDDRGFQKGDELVLCRYGTDWLHQSGFMNDRGDVVSSYPDIKGVDSIKRTITYVLTGGQFGIEPGFVVLGLTE